MYVELGDGLLYSQWKRREAERPAENCIFTSIIEEYSPGAYVGSQSVDEACTVIEPGGTFIP